MLHSFVDINMQILPGIVIVHIYRNIKIYSADGIHDLGSSNDIYKRITVNGKTDQFLNSPAKILDTVFSLCHCIGVNTVDLLDLGTDIYIGITRDIHDLYGMIDRIHPADHDGIRIVSHFIHPDDHKGIHTVFTFGIGCQRLG